MQSADARKRAVAQWVLVFSIVTPLALFAPQSIRAVRADEMQWIWTPAQPQEKSVPPGSVYFRKSFPLGQPESGEVQISCDNAYELYVNGRKVADGDNWRIMQKHDITKFLTPGRNTVAIKATVK
jgi:beta-galactosidase/beta-glucuronidase